MAFFPSSITCNTFAASAYLPLQWYPSLFHQSSVARWCSWWHRQSKWTRSLHGSPALWGSSSSLWGSCTHLAPWHSYPCPWWPLDDPCHRPERAHALVLWQNKKADMKDSILELNWSYQYLAEADGVLKHSSRCLEPASRFFSEVSGRLANWSKTTVAQFLCLKSLSQCQAKRKTTSQIWARLPPALGQ